MIFGPPLGVADAAWTMCVRVGMPTELHPTRRVEIPHVPYATSSTLRIQAHTDHVNVPVSFYRRLTTA